MYLKLISVYDTTLETSTCSLSYKTYSDLEKQTKGRNAGAMSRVIFIVIPSLLRTVAEINVGAISSKFIQF